MHSELITLKSCSTPALEVNPLTFLLYNPVYTNTETITIHGNTETNPAVTAYNVFLMYFDVSLLIITSFSC